MMKLKKLKEVIDACVENAGELDPNVEIWLEDKLYQIDNIGQFCMIPDVSIHLIEDGSINADDDITSENDKSSNLINEE